MGGGPWVGGAPGWYEEILNTSYAGKTHKRPVGQRGKAAMDKKDKHMNVSQDLSLVLQL